MSWNHYEAIKKYGEDVTIQGMPFDDDSDDDVGDEEEEERSEEDKSEERRKEDKVNKPTSGAVRNPEQGDYISNKSGTIFYTRPYNYLVKRDRMQIIEFLFWLGLQLETLEQN
jgi:hypothetical protein